MGQGPKCYKPSFIEIDRLILEKNISKFFFAIYSPCGHLGHLTGTIYTNFVCSSQNRLQIKFGFDWQLSNAVSEEILVFMLKSKWH